LTKPQALQTYIGVAYALAAGLAWGLVFLAPLLLAEYNPAMLSFGRYVAFGVVALVVAAFQIKALSKVTRADWTEAAKLSLIGNIVYYLGLAGAVQLADAPLPTMIIGTLPIVIALSSNWLDKRGGKAESGVAWSRLALPLGVLMLGLVLVNHAEQGTRADRPWFWWGIGLALLALVCWTWYPIRNAKWLQQHPHLDGASWATVQGLTTLPLALLGFAGLLALGKFDWGPTPERYIALMLLLGLVASWLGTWCWNRASQLLPTSLAGQLIVFETLAALAYAYIFRGAAPGVWAGLGIALLIIGVLAGLRAFKRA
jgi:drug/metabolite transporter (DMT)-like permease